MDILVTTSPRLRRLCDVVHLRTFSWKFRCPHPVARRLCDACDVPVGKGGKGEPDTPQRFEKLGWYVFFVLPSCLRFAWKRSLDFFLIGPKMVLLDGDECFLVKSVKEKTPISTNLSCMGLGENMKMWKKKMWKNNNWALLPGTLAS